MMPKLPQRWLIHTAWAWGCVRSFPGDCSAPPGVRTVTIAPQWQRGTSLGKYVYHVAPGEVGLCCLCVSALGSNVLCSPKGQASIPKYRVVGGSGRSARHCLSKPSSHLHGATWLVLYCDRRWLGMGKPSEPSHVPSAGLLGTSATILKAFCWRVTELRFYATCPYWFQSL